MEPTKRIIYSTKYALTQGIQVYHECEQGSNPTGKYWYYRGTANHNQHQFVIGSTGFFTREEAEKRAELIRQRKIKALKKQIAALEEMDFSK
jgi:hypothetical protein